MTELALLSGGELGAPDPYEKMSQAITLAETFSDLSHINDQIEALRQMARRADICREDQNRIAQLHIEWSEKIGRMRAAIPKAAGGHNKKQNKNDLDFALGKADADQQAGISHPTGKRCEVIAEIPEAVKAEYVKEAEKKEDTITLSGLVKHYKSSKKKTDLASAKEKFKAQDEAEDFDPPTIRKQDAFEFIDSFEDYSVDLLLTDPPYSTDVDDIEAFAKAWVPAAMSKVKATGRAYICIGAYPKELHAYLGVLLGLEGWIVDAPLIWTYRNALGQTPKHKYNLNYQVILHCYTELSNKLDTSITNEMFSVQDINAPDGRQGDRLHAWQKPDELANRLVRHSTKEGALVIDPFTCTGTFILAAARNGRVGIGSDINEENIEIGVSRGCRLQQGR